MHTRDMSNKTSIAKAGRAEVAQNALSEARSKQGVMFFN